MPLIRDAVGHELDVPEEALPYFPDYKVVKSDDKPGGEKSTAKTTTEEKKS